MLPGSITTLLTGVGAPGIRGTLHALRHNLDGVRINTVGTDMRADAVGRLWVDRFYQLPAPEDSLYIGDILEVCVQNEIDILIPQTTREVAVLSRFTSEFDRRGIRVMVADRSAIETANNKYHLSETFRELGLPHPAYRLATSERELVEAVGALGYPERPVVVKPPVSNGMRGFRVLEEEGWDARRFLDEKPSGEVITLQDLLTILRRGAAWTTLLVTDYLPGPEYSVDAFIGEHASIAVPRLRRSIRSGISFDSVLEFRDDLCELTLRTARQIGLRYAFGFQFKLDAEGIPKILECNPRVQGTMVASTFSGANVIWMAVRELIGAPYTASPRSLKPASFVRYWGGVGITEDQIYEI